MSFSALLPTIALLALFCACNNVSAETAVSEVSVKEFGAVGDGKADDTSAFENAIKKATENGLTIRVPSGQYRITRTLELKSLSLAGQDAGSWTADVCGLPKIMVETGKAPCVRLLAGGAVHGLQFHYDWKGADPHPAGACIELAGVGVRATDLKIFGAWDAIASDGKSNVGRALVSNCFIVDVHNVGVKITGTWDCSWVSKVEVWSPGSKNFLEKGVGFLFGKNDVLLVSDCFVFRAQTGFRFADNLPDSTIKGGTWGTMSNSSADYSWTAIEVDGANTVSISGGSFWTHGSGFVMKGKGGQVRLSGAEFKSNVYPTVDIKGGMILTMSGCQVRRDMKEYQAPAMRVTSDCSISATGCVFTSVSNALEMPATLRNRIKASNVVMDKVNPDKLVPNHVEEEGK